MLKSDLLEAEKEAKRFLERVKIMKQDDSYNNSSCYQYGANSASVKRSSLDLSKSLSKLRKSRW